MTRKITAEELRAIAPIDQELRDAAKAMGAAVAKSMPLVGAAPQEARPSQLPAEIRGRLAMARGHLSNIEAHGNTEASAVIVVRNVLSELEAALSSAPQEAEAVRIGDAVLDWMVKYDLLDGGNEYSAADVIAVLNDLTPKERPPAQAVTETSTAARFARLDGIVSRILWTDVGDPALDNEQTKAALVDLSEYLFAAGIDAALTATQEASHAVD